MINPGLQGRSVLVTGANNRLGIGAAIARAFARLGATLFLHYHRTPLDESTSAGVYRAQQANTADELLADIASLGGRAAERFCGSVDVLVNNAAAWNADTFLSVSGERRNAFLELWTDSAQPISSEPARRLFMANAIAPALLITEFARRHVQRGSGWGRIVNISTAASECFPSEASYGASKYALESYTRTAAMELGQFGITVNVLALGPVQTGWITPALEQALLPTLALGRIGAPDDVADVVVFLASEQARWVTGQKIFVDGGHRG